MATTDFNPTYDGYITYQVDCLGSTDGYTLDDSSNTIRTDLSTDGVLAGCNAYEQIYVGCDLDNDFVADTGTEYAEEDCIGNGYNPIYENGPTCIDPVYTGARQKRHGFLKFSGFSLPVGTITKVELIISLKAVQAQEDIYFTNLGGDPQGADPATLYANISGSSVYSTQSYASTGTKTIDLGASAVTQIISNATYFYIGLWSLLATDENGLPSISGYKWASSEDTPQPILRITYTPPAPAEGEYIVSLRRRRR